MSSSYSYYKKRPYIRLSEDDRICPECLKKGQRNLMRAGSSRQMVTYYYCQLKSCPASKKAIRPPEVEITVKIPDTLERR